jgi:hypothetical protein
MANKKKKKKSERQRNLEAYTKVLQILSQHPTKRLLRGRYYGNGRDGCELPCIIGILGNHFKFSDILRSNLDNIIERFPLENLQLFTRYIPISVLTELQMENDWRYDSEMSEEERYANMAYFLQQKIVNVLDPTKVTASA